MNSPAFLAAAAAAHTDNPVADIANQFGVTWQLLISQIILFGIVAFALKKFAYAPILDMLEQRRTRIAESLANADKIKAELAKAQATAQEVIGKASAQARRRQRGRTNSCQLGKARGCGASRPHTHKVISGPRRWRRRRRLPRVRRR